MTFRTSLIGEHFQLRKGLSYKGQNLVDESEIGLLTIDAFIPGGGYKRGSEKPYDGEYKTECVADPDDVLLAMTEQQEGLLASPLKVPEDLGGKSELVYSLDVAKLIPTSNEVLPEFIYNFLRIPINRQRAAYGDTGTTVQRLPFEVIYEQKIPIPSLAEQSRINLFISTLDRRIQLTIAKSETLNGIAQSIYRSWFIDFDPVLNKMNGIEPIGMNKSLAELFPDSMMDSELGAIPTGWQVGAVSQICTKVLNGSTPLRSNSEFWSRSDIAWYKSGELTDGFLFSPKESISEIALERSNVKMLPKGSVLMAIYAAPTVGRLGILNHDSTFNQACTGMMPRPEFGMPFLFLVLKNRRAWFNSFAIGAAQQNISKAVVEQCPLLIAPNEVHAAFDSIVSPIFQEISSLSEQRTKLEQIRDALLPQLISGEIRLPEELLVS